jgi:hypothetical protein
MAARRLIMVMLLLLFVSSLAAALAPSRDGEDETTTEVATTGATPRGELVEHRISADAKRPDRIKINLGDQLALTVTSKEPAQIEIPRLGEFEDADRYAPARFDLLPLSAGTYPVRLVETNREIGSIEVRKAKARSGDDRPDDEPPSAEPNGGGIDA